MFIISPYWSVWISHIRVSLFSIPSNYFVFKMALYLFVALCLLPAVFFMGRLLPLSYALLRKTKDNYGAVCGHLYFFNTLGTVAGTIVIGYLAFYLFNLDDLFKINVILLTALSFASALYEKKRFIASLSVCLAVFMIWLPNWNRTGHHLGYFRVRNPLPNYFQKVFSFPKIYEGQALFFEDGPNVSSTLIGYEKSSPESKEKDLFPSSKYASVSYVVNGKGIGNSIGDFSTVFLLSSLAYLYAPQKNGLSSALIGLGMGTTAGVLAKLEKVKDLTVLEIAPEVVDNVRRAPAFSFGLLDNPKAKIIEQDGFKYFTKIKKKFDVIVSEPSNPWIVGVENVFSYEFYELAKNTLTEDGVLVQWAQLYSIDAETLRIMFHTLKGIFPYAKAYRVGSADLAIIASSKPLKQKSPSERFFDPFLTAYYKALGFHKPEDLSLIQTFSETVFAKLAQSKAFGLHTLTTPKLAYRGDKTFFLGKMVEPEQLAPDYLAESSEIEDKKAKAFQKYAPMEDKQIKERCADIRNIDFFCHRLIRFRFHKKAFEDIKKAPLLRLKNYIYLRKRGLIQYNSRFMDKLKQEIIEKKNKNKKIILSYLYQLLNHGKYERAGKDIELFYKEGLFTKEVLADLKKHMGAAAFESALK